MAQDVEVVILGTAQDGGIPQAGCSCMNCIGAHNDGKLKRNPVCCGIKGADGSFHLIEAGRKLADQIMLWSKKMNLENIKKPETVSITHLHLGHIDGLGQFGKEVMNCKDFPLFASMENIKILKKKKNLSPFDCKQIKSNEEFSPTITCGFQLKFIQVPHRDEEGDTHAILIIGPNKSLLFLPDHDYWDETLMKYNKKTIREWLYSMKVDYALIDGTFWSPQELIDREMEKIPHPTISETIKMLGKKHVNDPEILFFHLNHSNPVININSKEKQTLNDSGWSLAEDGQVFTL
jgi:pyrroloquinoline quinone biosynthesis protein B